MDQQICGHEISAIIFVMQSRIVFKNFDSLFNTGLDQGGIIFYGVSWLSGFNKGGYGIYSVDIGLGGHETNNQVDPYHGSLIGSSVIVVDGGSIT